jgi:alpha-L-fucosidase
MRHFIIFTCTILVFNSHVLSQNLKGGGEANPDLLTNMESLENWRNLRFGMFVHWGPVSLKGTEIGWSRGREIPFNEYDNLYKRFNPVKFNASEWVSLIKEAGMKYLVFVSKHHDGFVMWDSETTEYDIMSTPYNHDVLMDLSRECERQGILFGTYYSICDWRHPDYPVEHNNPVKRTDADMEKYISYMKAQLKELVEKYHTKILWFDGEWEEPWTHEMGMDLYKYVRSLDNDIIINNRVDKGRHGMEGISLSEKFAGDFATPEQQVGRFDTITPWESCITICRQWAWKPDDTMKSKEESLLTLIKTAGGDGNLLYNVGPMPDGSVEQRQADRLREMGDWLNRYGESIHETRGGPLPPEKWGVTTHHDNLIFLHVLNPVRKIKLRKFDREVKSVYSLNDIKKVGFSRKKDDIIIRLPMIKDDAIDYILVLELE